MTKQAPKNQAVIPYEAAMPSVPRLSAEIADPNEPRVLLQGVDTVYFSFMEAISDAMWETLLGEQQEARERGQERGV